MTSKETVGGFHGYEKNISDFQRSNSSDSWLSRHIPRLSNTCTLELAISIWIKKTCQIIWNVAPLVQEHLTVWETRHTTVTICLWKNILEMQAMTNQLANSTHTNSSLFSAHVSISQQLLRLATTSISSLTSLVLQCWSVSSKREPSLHSRSELIMLFECTVQLFRASHSCSGKVHTGRSGRRSSRTPKAVCVSWTVVEVAVLAKCRNCGRIDELRMNLFNIHEQRGTSSLLVAC